MAWRKQKPEVVTDLEGLGAYCKTDACRLALAGYAKLRETAGGAIPAKNGLDLRYFVKSIPDLVLVALIKPDQCIFRIAGENVRERYGQNPVGRNYFDMVPKERRESVMHSLAMVVDVPCGYRIEIEQIYENGLTGQVEAVVLPLTSDEPGIDGFLLVVESLLNTADRIDYENRTLLGSNVMERQMADLGFGIDTSFEDVLKD